MGFTAETSEADIVSKTGFCHKAMEMGGFLVSLCKPVAHLQEIRTISLQC